MGRFLGGCLFSKGALQKRAYFFGENNNAPLRRDRMQPFLFFPLTLSPFWMTIISYPSLSAFSLLDQALTFAGKVIHNARISPFAAKRSLKYR